MSNPYCFDSISLRFFIMPMSLRELEGDSWFVAELQRNMQSFLGGFIQRVCESKDRGVGCSTAYSRWYHMGRLQSRKRLAGGHTLASSGLHCRWYAENAVLLGYWEDEWYLVAETFVGSCRWDYVKHTAKNLDLSVAMVNRFLHFLFIAIDLVNRLSAVTIWVLGDKKMRQ